VNSASSSTPKKKRKGATLKVGGEGAKGQFDTKKRRKLSQGKELNVEEDKGAKKSGA
jgi:hypothetical protein